MFIHNFTFILVVSLSHSAEGSGFVNHVMPLYSVLVSQIYIYIGVAFSMGFEYGPITI